MEPIAYCLAFSEPEHGSDLASVETRGDIRGNSVVVTGVKTWVAHADQASAALVLCVTEPAAPRCQNLSCVLVALGDNAVELRPMRQMAGESDLFEARFDGARAPLANLVGGRGGGLRVAAAELTRAWRRRWQNDEREFWDLVETARRYGRDQDPLVRQQLAWAYSQIQVIRVLADKREPPLRGEPQIKDFLLERETEVLRSGPPTQNLLSEGETELLRSDPPETELVNLLWSEYHRRFGEIAIEITGADGLLRPDGEAFVTNRWQQLFLTSRGDTIAARTSELQRTILAERLLGLPK